MPEVQSCSAVCAKSRPCSLDFSAPLECIRDQIVERESVNVIAELSTELRKERKKNAELMEKISLLEAQLHKREDASFPRTEQEVCPIAIERCFKKFKRQKLEPRNGGIENSKIVQSGDVPQVKEQDTSCRTLDEMDITQQDLIVNWMSMGDAQFLNFEKFKDGDIIVDCEDTDESGDEDVEYCDEEDAASDSDPMKNDESPQFDYTLKKHIKEEERNQGRCSEFSQKLPGDQSELAVISTIPEISRDLTLPDMRSITSKEELRKDKKIGNTKIIGCKEMLETHNDGKDIGHKGYGSITPQRKPPKVPFCPKEIKRIIGSEVLLPKNAQSHTIRKIIVFASLGIRHGCEDMYELDFNDFSILRKGESYVSPTNPGEHVLFEHPGVQRKIFYPNRQNPILCPVQILEEEKAMRPSDPSCPSCLFLCIKYGGRTRNLPQNEYVRQRMGRNKLKSFGPLMCQTAMLINTRSGSFFFKAFGITLLFMAGISEELIQRETKYRNLDLLQKYYRTDEDAEGEELFHLYSVPCDVVGPNSQRLAEKTSKASKKQTGLTSKPRNLPISSTISSSPSSSIQPTQFGLMGYSSLQNLPMAASPSIPPHNISDARSVPNNSITCTIPGLPYHASQIPYPMFPPHPANTFMPMVYWPHTNAFPPCPYPTSYGYRSFPHSVNYMSIHPQPYYGHPSCTLPVPKVVEGFWQKEETLGEEDSDSSSSSSSSEPKRA